MKKIFLSLLGLVCIANALITKTYQLPLIAATNDYVKSRYVKSLEEFKKDYKNSGFDYKLENNLLTVFLGKEHLFEFIDTYMRFSKKIYQTKLESTIYLYKILLSDDYKYGLSEDDIKSFSIEDSNKYGKLLHSSKIVFGSIDTVPVRMEKELTKKDMGYDIILNTKVFDNYIFIQSKEKFLFPEDGKGRTTTIISNTNLRLKNNEKMLASSSMVTYGKKNHVQTLMFIKSEIVEQ